MEIQITIMGFKNNTSSTVKSQGKYTSLHYCVMTFLNCKLTLCNIAKYRTSMAMILFIFKETKFHHNNYLYIYMYKPNSYYLYD